MAQTCSKCSRANPADAVYCYFDGFVLAGHSKNGGPVAVGAQTFASPFVFPSGRTCRNFNELALACVEEWDSARDLLKQGYLATFLGGLGRMDLVTAAKAALKYPDADRALDQFLNKLPSDTLGEPKLNVETRDLNLGVVPVGTERRFVIHLENQGMRLLYGSVTCSDKTAWLTLGDTPGTMTKSIQFSEDLKLAVKVAPDRLRAGAKPLEGSLLVETNGGTATIKIRAEVPVKAFPPGVLGGAMSPRQVAEKAKPKAKEAAPLFENGAVAAWYKNNGWTYPVQGPPASGVGAVQQFFEALGLTPAPKVQISERQVALRGSPGATLRHVIKVETQEKRPVYAHAASNQPWLEVSRAKLNGRTASINLSIPSVPNRPGETLTANLTVQSNGNQRFVVPITLTVNGTMTNAKEVLEAPVKPAFAPVASTARVPVPIISAKPFGLSAPTATAAFLPSRHLQSSGSPLTMLLHAVPAMMLALALFFVLCWDVIAKGKKPTEKQPLVFTATPKENDTNTSGDKGLKDNDPLIGVNFSHNYRFGLLMLKEHDPKNPDQKKRLTYKEDGSSNNTCININGSGNLFGVPPGRSPIKGLPVQVKDRPAWEVTWDYDTDKIKVTQHIEIVRGEQSGRLDTCLVWYRVENYGLVEQNVGLRVMLDTFIGANDGVPFVIPGRKGLLTDKHDFSEKEIPDYVEALEYPDLAKPGTVAHLGLKGIVLPNVQLETIERMVICRWPGSEIRWDLDKKRLRSIEGDKQAGEEDDSCVFLYWPYRPTAKGEVRHMAFTYGLGKMTATPAESGNKTQLALTAGGSFRPGGEFTVTAYIKGAEEGQKIKLDLPSGLSFLANDDAEKTVEAADKKAGYSQVSWRVKGGKVGDYEIQATSGGVTAKDKVKLKTEGLFPGG